MADILGDTKSTEGGNPQQSMDSEGPTTLDKAVASSADSERAVISKMQSASDNLENPYYYDYPEYYRYLILVFFFFLSLVVGKVTVLMTVFKFISPFISRYLLTLISVLLFLLCCFRYQVRDF